MGVARFFVPPESATLEVGGEVDLPSAVAHHAARVLRLREGGPLVLFDGRGGEYAATLVEVGKRGARVRIERHEAIERESPHAVTLAQAVVASEPMEIIVRKAVELGAHAIAPILAARSQGSQVPPKRLAHWRAIAVAACEQCGRNRVPAIAEPVPLALWIAVDLPHRGPAVMLAPGAGKSLASVAAARAPCTLLVGPEGGWTGDELAAAIDAGIATAHLGSRILRAETGALSALATINAVVGDAR
jgi:16S rRNA (uracil1498-N3)-methyltransferase